MSVVQTILVFVVVPGAVVAGIALLIWGPVAARGPRYRPGREWKHQPVWYAPHPQALRDAEHVDPHGGQPELTASSPATSGGTASVTASTAAGGARGTW